MLKPLFRIAFLAFLLYIPIQTFAWGAIGHRIIGQIADSYLNARARKQIVQILGNETIAMSSNWADFIKSDPSYNYLNTWHYVNLKDGLSYAEVQQQLQSDTGTNAFTKLNFLISELKSGKLESEEKKMYLRLLIHIVGDLHQPMHTGRPEDLGGNRIRVSWFSTPSNLHRVWDEHLIDLQQLSYTEYTAAINFTTKQQRAEWQAQSITEWIFESYQISNRLYAQITKPDEVLGYNYNFLNQSTLNQQLLKGGVHLAGILNDIFK